MNLDILYTLAGVASALAGFSGVVVVFRQQGVRDWTPPELRYLWFLIGDSFLVVLFSLIPVPMHLAGWSEDLIWALCCALLGTWFVAANIIAISGEVRDRKTGQYVPIPLVSPTLIALTVVGAIVAVALWLAAFDLLVPRGEAIYIVGLIVLLAFAGLEFMFFIGRAAVRPTGKGGPDT